MKLFRSFNKQSRSKAASEVEITGGDALCLQCRDKLSEIIQKANSGGRRLMYEGSIWKASREWESYRSSCALCKIIREQLQDRESDRVSNSLGIAPATFHYLEACTHLDGYHTPWYPRHTNPGMGDVHAARLDVFKVGSHASDIDFRSKKAGLAMPVWKGMQKDIPSSFLDRATFELISKWIEVCHLDHPRCRRSIRKPLPTRVLDIGIEGLVEKIFLRDSGGSEDCYVALSHRWGYSVPLRTTSENVRKHREGIEVRDLPATFMHAVMILQTLGIRYIWIDSLCIIQDDNDDWKHEAAKMAAVYSNALFTISASDAESTEEGIVRDAPEPHQATFSCKIKGRKRPVLVGVRSGLPIFRHAMRDSPLQHRGWIFQERALSLAVLHFCNRQIHWECVQGVMSQAVPFDEFEESSPMQQLVRIFGDDESRTSSSLDSRMWEELLHAYNFRVFTKAADKADAFLGIATTLMAVAKFETHAGLSQKWLHADLCWTFYSPKSPAVLDSDSEQQPQFPPPRAISASNQVVTLKPSAARRSRYPTWSWMSVDYPIEYRGIGNSRLEPPFDLHFRFVRFEAPIPSRMSQELDYHPYGVLHLHGTIVQSGVYAPPTDDWRISWLQFTVGTAILAVSCSIDPGCSHGANMFVLPLCYEGEGIQSLEKVHFLVLQRTDVLVRDTHPEAIGVFKRVGVGHGSRAEVRTACKAGIVGHFALV